MFQGKKTLAGRRPAQNKVDLNSKEQKLIDFFYSIILWVAFLVGDSKEKS